MISSCSNCLFSTGLTFILSRHHDSLKPFVMDNNSSQNLIIDKASVSIANDSMANNSLDLSWITPTSNISWNFCSKFSTIVSIFSDPLVSKLLQISVKLTYLIMLWILVACSLRISSRMVAKSGFAIDSFVLKNLKYTKHPVEIIYFDMANIQSESHTDIQEIKNELVHETTVEKSASGVNLAGFTTKSVESSLNMAPNWIYGTTSPKRNISSNGSGLLLATKGHIAIASPEVIQNYLYPISESLEMKILKYRDRISGILNSDLSTPNPLLVITGPSYIKHANQIKGCAQWIGGMLGKSFPINTNNQLFPRDIKDIFRKPFRCENLMLSIRANLTNYNFDYNSSSSDTSIMTYEISRGMPYCRALLDEISEICPIVGETSDTITPQYLGDLFCLGLVSSSLVESQLHRELASGASYPIGFQTLDSHLSFNKPMYSNRIQNALDAMFASKQQHQFLSVTKVGTVAVVGTTGNDETFIVLEVNLQLSYEELVELIENKVYKDKKLVLRSPRIILDLGKISSEEYHQKLSIIQRFLTESLKNKILGVLIDSGDDYVPKTCRMDLESHTEATSFDYNESFEELHRYFQRNRISSNEKLNQLSSETSSYEYFVNANKMIQELDKLSGSRLT